MEKIKDILLKLFKFENIAANFTGYVETRLELFKLEIKTDLAKALAKVVTLIFICFLGFLFLLFVSLGVSHLINTLLDSNYAGFLIIASLYGIILFTVVSNRKKIMASVEEQILKRTSKNKE